MSMDVWMVTQGSYSDYRVVALYATRDIAERAAELLRADMDDEPRITSEPLRNTPDLIRQVSYQVPIRRRSGEPTVTECWTPSSLTADTGVQETWAMQDARNWRRRTHVVYTGERIAAHACARAMAQQLHGEVVGATR